MFQPEDMSISNLQLIELFNTLHFKLKLVVIKFFFRNPMVKPVINHDQT